MPKSLLEQLPEIVANGRKQAEKILESLESRQRVRLQTREVVLPAKDSAAQDWVTLQQRSAQQAVFAPGQASLLPSAQATLGAAPDAQASAPWANRLIYGDNLLAMAALLAGDEDTPSLRGKVVMDEIFGKRILTFFTSIRSEKMQFGRTHTNYTTLLSSSRNLDLMQTVVSAETPISATTLRRQLQNLSNKDAFTERATEIAG